MHFFSNVIQLISNELQDNTSYVFQVCNALELQVNPIMALKIKLN